MNQRRNFIKQGGLLSVASFLPHQKTLLGSTATSANIIPEPTKWADGSRLVVSVSMQFEAGGQPENAESPFPQNLQKGYRDLPASTWYEYGYKEGIPRMLDNWDRLGIKVSSHMVGTAVLKNPA